MTEEAEQGLPLLSPSIEPRVEVPKISYADDLKLLFCIALGAILYACPPPKGLSIGASDTFAVFISLMLAILLTNKPMSILVSLALTCLVLGQSLECERIDGTWIECADCNGTDCDPFAGGFKTALSGFSQPIVFMIFSAFHLGRAVEIHNLGKRISLILMKHMGFHIVGLGMSVFISELLLAPFIPSNTARGGSIVLPIVMSLVNTLGSTPDQNKAIGKYLVLCGSHANLLISSFFITAAAPNPVIVATAQKIFDIKFTFSSWTLGAVFPGLLCMIILPFAFYYLYRPVYDGNEAVKEATHQLQTIGPMSFCEIKLLTILLIALTLWITGDISGIPETFVAYLAMVTLLLTNTLTWEEVASNSKAWDAFYWLSGMLVIAEQLSKLGISAYFGSHVAVTVRGITSSPIISALLLGFFYYITMYMFSSITGHAIALAGPFLAAGKHLNVSPYFITSLIGVSSSLSASLTHFSTGSVVLYFARGFFKQGEWMLVGLGVSIFYFFVYSTFGLFCWKSLEYF